MDSDTNTLDGYLDDNWNLWGRWRIRAKARWISLRSRLGARLSGLAGVVCPHSICVPATERTRAVCVFCERVLG